MGRASRRRDWKSAAARRVMEFAGVSDIDQAVDRIALDLLEGVSQPPTDLYMVMKRLNVCRIETSDELMVTGALKKNGMSLIIQVFPGLSKGRRRFTIAHELGHAFMETTGSRPPRRGRELEDICDKIAAEILMPRRSFVQYASRTPNIACLLEVAKIFGTSRSAAFRRGRELYGFKACELEDSWSNWSFGMGNIEKSILRSILRNRQENSGIEEIHLNSGRGYNNWRMEWRRMEVDSRMICLLTR